MVGLGDREARDLGWLVTLRAIGSHDQRAFGLSGRGVTYLDDLERRLVAAGDPVAGLPVGNAGTERAKVFAGFADQPERRHEPGGYW